ncbi:helix-turn-helix domain-containing protein [Acetobacter conturbans]|uniref:Fis family transcriptional regulator n=1 Tax=Acetobacter conturbans TaxID=1737472 RepID=A0ABX0JZS6_9PROT|nr:helix-turn-helix domain-containing protein [Acetobacter conturbans]NHN87958.1 Fis family transcriptional regulator [Acetobacter conturbans]
MKSDCARSAEACYGPPAGRDIPGEIAKSWQRCARFYQLDPAQSWRPDVLSGAEFRHVSGRSAFLLKAGLPEMRRLFALVQGLNMMVLLADPDAMILARCLDETHQSVSRRLELRKGAIWTEKVAGTNGIGTSVEECCPIVLGQGEHWRFCFALLASYAVPIFDPYGRVAGALNLAALSGNTTRPVAGLLLEILMQSGRRIEEQLFRDYHEGEKILSLGMEGGCSAPLVAINDVGEVTGATYASRRLTGWTDEMIEQRPCFRNEMENHNEISFRQAEAGVIRAGLALSQGNASAAARNLGISRATLYRKMKSIGMK